MVYKALWGPSVRLHTSSISTALSARDAWVTHFSTTLLNGTGRVKTHLVRKKRILWLKLWRNERETGKRIRTKPWVCSHLNLPCKLVLAESQNVASDLSHYLALILSSAVLQNMLDDIVAILVLNKPNHKDTLTKMWGRQLVLLTSHQTRSQLQKSGLRKSLF